jgi:hypothetical protein
MIQSTTAVEPATTGTSDNFLGVEPATTDSSDNFLGVKQDEEGINIMGY